MIRLLLVLILVIVYLILSIILIPLMYLIGLFSKKARDYSSLRLIQGLFKTILFLSGVKLRLLARRIFQRTKLFFLSATTTAFSML